MLTKTVVLPGCDGSEHVGGAGDHGVAAEHKVGPTGGDAHGPDVRRRGGDAHMAGDRPALAGESGDVDHRGSLAFQMRRHGDERADGDDAGAADAGDDDGMAAVERRQARRIGQFIVRKRRHGLSRHRPMHGDEARAVTLEAGEVRVAERRIDGALAPEFGLDRLDGDAVRLDAAIAAAIADALVDDHLPVRRGLLPALAPPSFLDCASLVVDQHRDAAGLCEFALHAIEIVATVDADTRRQSRVASVALRFLAHHDDLAGAFGKHRRRDRLHRRTALRLLPAGQRRCTVEQDLEGDGNARRDRRTHDKRAGMDIGAVANVLEDVAAGRERRFADPACAFAAELGMAFGMPVWQVLGHQVAAHAGIGTSVAGHGRANIVRTAGAERRRAFGDVADTRERLLGMAQGGKAPGKRFVLPPGDQARTERDGDPVAGERALGRKQPLPRLVPLAEDRRLVGGAVQDLLDLALDQAALLLDHDDRLEVAGEVADSLRVERPRAGELQEAQAEIGGAHLVDAEVVQRLADIEIALARGDDADARLAPAGKHHPVRRVGAQKGGRRRDPEFVQPLFLRRRIVTVADGKPAGRHAEAAGNDRRDTIERAVDGGGRRDDVGHAFQPHPGTGIARQRIAEEAVIENLLDTRRTEHGDHGIDKGVFGLVRDGREFASVIVADQRQDPAPGRGAGEVGVLQRLAGARDARSRAVPQAEDPVEAAVAAQFRLLRPPQGGRRKRLVDAGVEDDARRLQNAGRLFDLPVKPAQRRAAMAADVAGRAGTRAPVTRLLHQQEAHHRLAAAHQHPLFGEIVLVTRADGRKDHASPPRAGWAGGY